MTATETRGGECQTSMLFFTAFPAIPFDWAEAIAEGVTEVPRCQPKLLLIGEPNGATAITMPGLEKRHHQYSHVRKAAIQDLVDCDGLALGSPVYWGGMSLTCPRSSDHRLFESAW